MRSFPTCHCHQQSLDSASTPEAFAQRELELGTGVLTVTDHGSLAACRKVYDLAKEKGLTPVLGLEAYFRDDDCPILTAAGLPKNDEGKFSDNFKYAHITMHFQDQAAYECAVRLLSKADERAEKHGSERKPLFDWAALEELGSHNVTFGTGCLIGMVQRHLFEREDMDSAKAYLERLKSIAKPGNLYVELFPHECSKNWVSGVFLELENGDTLRYYAKKWVRTDAGEIQVDKLAREFKSGKHKALIGVCNYRVWQELPPVEIKDVKHIEDFIENECRPWCPDGDVQCGLNKVMRHLAKAQGLRTLISDDSHFSTPDEKIIQDVRLAQNGNWRFWTSYHRQSSEEAFAYFSSKLGTTQAEFDSWVDNGYEWAEKFKNFVFDSPPSLPTKFYEVNYPKYSWYKEGDPDNSLRYTLELIKKHGRMDWSKKDWAERLKKEIGILHNNGTIDLLPYFFIDEEVCSVHEEAGELTGPGRGSAAGLLLSYLLGITHVEPLKYGLSLERFLTEDRIKSGKLPDIDQDLPHQDLLIKKEAWLKKRFGDHCARISTDMTLRLSQAAQDVARFRYGYLPPEVVILTKKFKRPPQGVSDFDFVFGYESDEGFVPGSVEKDPVLQEYIRRYPEDWKIVQIALGLPRQRGKHPCGFVIANRPIGDFIPLTTVGDEILTAYTAPSVEAVGGVKMDFLVVNSLKDIRDAVQLAQKRHSNSIDFSQYKLQEHNEACVGWSGPALSEKRFSAILDGKRVPSQRLLPWNGRLVDIWDLPHSRPVFADVACGRTESVFQFNTGSARQCLQHFRADDPDGDHAINSIATMSIFTALDRPGPLDMFVSHPNDPEKKHDLLVEYARRAKGEEGSPDILPIFDKLFPETYGIMTFQEQLQKAYQQLTGCSGAEAEAFRRDAAKKKKSKIEKAYKPFIEAASEKIGKDGAEAAWKFFTTWASYGFCLAHSTTYATIAYTCAFLKHYYPLEWWTSVLRNASKNEINEKFWRHCGRLIDLPDVNLSGDGFEIQNERIRAPVTLLHGVGETAHRELLTYVPCKDIAELCQKIEKHKIDTGTLVRKKKTKKTKVLNPETGKKESISTEIEVEQLKKGHSALNRGAVYTLILSGAMDSLFPPDLHVSEQLQAYENALAEATGAKVRNVDGKAWDLGPIGRYQLRKKILPAYTTDLPKLLVEIGADGFSSKPSEVLLQTSQGFSRDTKDLITYQWRIPKCGDVTPLRVVNASELEVLDASPIDDNDTLMVACVGYVISAAAWKFGPEQKEAFKLHLDIDGVDFEFVKWPSRNGTISPALKDICSKSIVVAILTKYRTGKAFAIEDVVTLYEPIKDKEEKDEDDNA